MEFYQYLALSIAIASGILAGAFVAYNSSEELKDGLKFIKAGMLGVFYINVFLTSITFFQNYLFSVFVPTIILLVSFYLPKNALGFSKDYFFLIILSVCLFLDMKILNYIVPSLIFVNLCLLGAIQYAHLEGSKNKKGIYVSLLIRLAVFIALANVLFFF